MTELYSKKIRKKCSSNLFRSVEYYVDYWHEICNNIINQFIKCLKFIKIYLLNLNKYYTIFTNWHNCKACTHVSIRVIGNLQIGFIYKIKTYTPQKSVLDILYCLRYY